MGSLMGSAVSQEKSGNRYIHSSPAVLLFSPGWGKVFKDAFCPCRSYYLLLIPHLKE